ncbi:MULTISPECIES: MFS transporter permease [unclassified Microbacterium]|uniref:MFS transporter permease n=1 Tax=unclassified Microbacterium TaxID=2609290 RepID=UPI002468BAD0|nr:MULTISPECIES: MFS transporter permease [unclassified Microbacterium]MDH5133583.1 MFS transporter permease [Microbacterium sp. RD10]MDH5138075.1 MFS transporter permease [Microbacterium sp. RD11]MDH5145960.1 MFS transporter permease [Microbacterium sp. RD12]MDH5156056.1 MFS transporter permease [Microbacterium sp. RD06]MDH5166995.1 MFS transporter permease [Microbacterium sp. RD02]
MWIRQAFFRWLLPSAFLLPLWLLIGWAVFQGGWSILWVLLIAMPSVFVGQLLLTLLTRSRPSVRAERALSWWDVAGFGLWHALTIAVGFFIDGAFGWLLAAAIVVGIGLVWLQLWQLWNEARGSGARIRETISWSTMTAPRAETTQTSVHEVIVVRETDDRP